MVAIMNLGLADPEADIASVAIAAILVGVAGATFDIVIDAYRIESAPERLQAAMAASYMTGYRLAMIMAGAGALALAAPAWSYVAANGLVVQPDGEGTFNVPFMGLSGDTDFWCAAGDYVNNFLGEFCRHEGICKPEKPVAANVKTILFQ